MGYQTLETILELLNTHLRFPCEHHTMWFNGRFALCPLGREWETKGNLIFPRITFSGMMTIRRINEGYKFLSNEPSHYKFESIIPSNGEWNIIPEEPNPTQTHIEGWNQSYLMTETPLLGHNTEARLYSNNFAFKKDK